MKRGTVQAAERLYTIEEAAALWSVSRDTIERLLRSEELRSVTVANRRRIPASALEAYASRGQEGTR